MSDEEEQVTEPPSQTWSVAVTGGLAALAVAALATIPRVLYSEDWIGIVWMGLLFLLSWGLAWASGIAGFVEARHRGRNAGALLCLIELLAIPLICLARSSVIKINLETLESLENNFRRSLQIQLFPVFLILIGGVLAGLYSRGRHPSWFTLLALWFLPGQAFLLLFNGFRDYFLVLLGPLGALVGLRPGEYFIVVPIVVLTGLLLTTAWLTLRSRSNNARFFWLVVLTGAVFSWILLADVVNPAIR